MRLPLSFLLILLIVAADVLSAQRMEFSQENAAALLKTLVKEIGPRPMGSPAERRALAFAASKFSEYGCQQSSIMRMAVADGVNTTSGIAIGVSRGSTNRIIVIGAHIDSSSPDVPGANDDGSGVACVLELARVICSRPHTSTVMFCCWGGEEEGLEGSTYFVEHFEQLDSVALMLQIDMADGAGSLEIDPDGEKASAPRWLTEAAYDVFFNDLRYSGLIYPVHSATVNAAANGATGSDHIPFLAKGIPAIDFTSDVTYPIHTPQDSWENFSPRGLQRSGGLVLRLFERFDGGVPGRSTDHYLLLQVGHSPVILPYWMLWSFVILSLVVSVMAYAVSRRRRDTTETAKNVRWSGLKLLLYALIIQMCIWFSADIVGVVRGYRFPWVNNFGGFVLLALLCGLLGIWVVVQLAGRYRLTSDHFVFARVAVTMLFVETIFACFSTPKLAIYPASALLLFSLSMLAKKPGLKFVLFALSPLLMFRLMFSEWLGLFQRLLASGPSLGLWQNALFELALALILVFYFLPFVYGFAAVYRDSRVDLLWLTRWRTKASLIVLLIAAVGVAGILMTRPVYDQRWFTNVRAEQRSVLGSDSSTVILKGSEYLDGVEMVIDGRDTLFSGRSTFMPVQMARRAGVRWCSLERTNTVLPKASDTVSTIRLERRVHLHSALRPLRVTLSYSSSTDFDVESPWAHGGRGFRGSGGESPRRKSFSWYAFPDSDFVVPVTFTLPDSQAIAENFEIIYDTLSYPLVLRRPLTNFSHRTIVTGRDTIRVHPG